MPRQKEILFVSHDANRAGAQIFLLNIMKHLHKNGYKIILLLVNDWGSMRDEFEENFVTYSLNHPPKSAIDRFFKSGTSTIEIIKTRHNIDLIYANTIASVNLIEALKTCIGAPVLTHIHELQYSIMQYGVPDAENILFRFSDKVIACSEAVAKNLQKYGSSESIEVIHSFVNNDAVISIYKTSEPKNILNEFGLDSAYTWVCACGNADWRKAPDIFVQIAAKVTSPHIKFAWIGIKQDDILLSQLKYDAERLNIAGKIHWIEPTSKAVALINAMDYFLLCSREDPFPLVMLEAALCQKPVLTFKNTGGGDEFVQEDAGVRVDYLDVNKMAQEIDLMTPEKKLAFGVTGQKKVLDNYSFENSILKIEGLIESFL